MNLNVEDISNEVDKWYFNRVLKFYNEESSRLVRKRCTTEFATTLFSKKYYTLISKKSWSSLDREKQKIEKRLNKNNAEYLEPYIDHLNIIINFTRKVDSKGDNLESTLIDNLFLEQFNGMKGYKEFLQNGVRYLGMYHQKINLPFTDNDKEIFEDFIRVIPVLANRVFPDLIDCN